MSSRGPALAPSSNGSSGPSANPGSPHRTLRRLAVAATTVTFLLVAAGALVRATGSGLGCSGWPKCSAHHWLPPLQYHAIIEYTHRMTAFVDIVLVGLLAVVAWRRYRDVPRILRPALAAAGLIVVQAVLGGIVVEGELAALLVTAHFATAMVLAATLVYATVAAFTLPARPVGAADALTTFSRVVALVAFGLLVVGAYVRGAGAGLVFADWPLMAGRVVPPLGSEAQALMFTHRVLALATGVLIAVLVVRAWRMRADRPAVAVLSGIAAALYVAQVLIGAANVWSRLAQPAVVGHVTVSSLIWGALVATAVTARASQAGEPAADRLEPAMAARAVSG